MKTNPQTPESMPCFECNEGMLEPVTLDYASHHPELGEFTVLDVPMAKCSACGDTVLPHEGHRKLDAYLDKALNVITPEEVQAFLSKYRLTQKEASYITGYGEKNISRWVTGRSRPSQSVSNFLRILVADESAFERLRAKNFDESETVLPFPVQEKQPDENEKEVLKSIDYSQLCRLGVLAPTNSPKEKRTQLCRWSGSSNLLELRDKMTGSIQQMAAFKDTGKKSNPVSGGIWVTLGKERAAPIKTAPYSREKLHKAIKKLRELSVHPLGQVTDEVRDTLAKAGVALVCLPSMKQSALRGCTCLLTPNKALIIHSLKYKTYAQFWVVLFHEIAHLLLHIEKPGDGLADYEDQKQDEKEQEADTWAYDTLFSLNAHLEFRRQYKAGEFWQVERFAKRERVHPAIVADIVNKREEKEFVPFGLLIKKGLFPHLTQEEVERLTTAPDGGH